MKKRLPVLLAVCLVILLMALPAYAAETSNNVIPTAQDNLQVGLRSSSELVVTSDGYMRVFYDGEKIGIEYYDNNFNIQSKKTLSMELSAWGGFYAGSDAYYLVEGQANTAESDTAEVIRVIKYDTNWNKKGTAKITSNPDLFGGEVRYPFDYGCVEMTEYNGTLYIVTGHQGYVDPLYNQGHQGFLMIAVNTASMTGKIVDCDLWHSFAQYIGVKDSYLYVLEQSEGSRYTKLSRYNAENINQNTSIPVLKYGGSPTSAWAIACFASVDGMAVSSSNVLCLGTSIDQTKYDTITSDDEHNIYLTVTPISNFTESATTVKWLTNYSGGGKCFLGTKITKINDNRFMVSWEEYETSQTASTSDSLSGSILHYIFIDGNGNKLTKEFTAAAPISDCQPIVNGSKVVYYASNGNMVDFYSIDAETGSFSKKAYRVAGENATWELSGNVLTISGTGAMSGDMEGHDRYPVSSTRNWYSSSQDNAWKAVRDKTGKIVIRCGITSIPDSAFEYFNNLTEVEIQSGVKSIGKKAFYGNQALRKITIPASVTSIGEDILWTGYYWVSDNSHVVYATIYGYKGSYAETYAKKEGIQFVTLVSAPKLSKVENVNGGVKITWDKVNGAEKYRVFYKTGSGSWTRIADTTSTSYTWTGAKSGTDYAFTVRCISSDAKSYTSSCDTIGLSIKYIAAPKLSGLENTATGMKITWDKVNGAEKYRVFYKTGSGVWTRIADTTSTSYTWTGAKSGTNYTFTVRCISNDAKSYTSGYDNTGKSLKYVAAPKLSGVTNTSTGVNITWDKVSGAEKYRVFYKTGSGAWTRIADTTSTSYTWTGAKSGTNYAFTVRCISSDAKSYTSGCDSTGKSIQYLSQPKITSMEANNSGLKITWGKVTGATIYRVYYKSSTGWKMLRETTGTTCTLNVTIGKSYQYTVRAFNGSTSSSFHSGTSFMRMATPKLSGASNTGSGIKVSWGKVSGAAKYRVYYKIGSGSWIRLADTTSTSYTWTGAKKGTTYTFTVRCITSDGSVFTSGFDTTGKTVKYTGK